MKQTKFIVAICATVLSLALLICACVYMDGTLTGEYGASYAKDEIDALQYELNAAKWADKNGHWDEEFYTGWFDGGSGYDPYASSWDDEEEIRSFDSVKAALKRQIGLAQKTYNAAIGLPLCVLVLSLALFMGSGAMLTVECISLFGRKSKKAEETTDETTEETDEATEEQTQEELPEALECPECGGRIPVIKGESVLTCEKCGAQYQNPYQG